MNHNDMDWTSSDLIYVITWTEIDCECNMLDKLADPLRLGFVSTLVKWKSLKNLTRFFIAILKKKLIHLVKI